MVSNFDDALRCLHAEYRRSEDDRARLRQRVRFLEERLQAEEEAKAELVREVERLRSGAAELAGGSGGRGGGGSKAGRYKTMPAASLRAAKRTLGQGVNRGGRRSRYEPMLRVVWWCASGEQGGRGRVYVELGWGGVGVGGVGVGGRERAKERERERETELSQSRSGPSCASAYYRTAVGCESYARWRRCSCNL